MPTSGESSESITAKERGILSGLADVLIPAGEGFPSASQAGVAGQGLDRLLSFRPDLAAGLKRLLAECDGMNAAEAVEKLRKTDPSAIGILEELVPGAFFLDPTVRQQLAYSGQGPRSIEEHPDYLENGLLQSVIDRGPIYRPTPAAPLDPSKTSAQLPRYDWHKSYAWNYENAPAPLPPRSFAATGKRRWGFCGIPTGSPLGIAAGPLLNGKWILYYASLGFDVLTYKTVRSRSRPSYPLPNLQPVTTSAIVSGDAQVVASKEMGGSWAVSFGMPSMSPEIWRRDIETTRKALSREQVLSVSVVATPEPHWTLEDLAADYCQCAAWAVESGADVIEANFSCPNVASADAQLYQQPDAAGFVAARLRRAIGSTPLLLKIGHVNERASASRLAAAVAPVADALVMVNCITARVLNPSGGTLFDGERRGIAGPAIRKPALEQARMFVEVIREIGVALRVVGVGGISNAADVRVHLDAGCHAVQVATAAMLDPELGFKIRSAL